MKFNRKVSRLRLGFEYYHFFKMKKNGGGFMKTHKKLYSATFASVVLILFLILVSSVASAATPMITETRITTNPSNSMNPDIYGNTIVWQDDRNGNWDIYIFNISTKEEIHTTNKSNQVSPAIYGNRVVWEDERNGGHDIYLQDLFYKKQTRITTSGKAINPAIYGDKIVWADGRNGGSFNEEGGPFENWDIYLYDLSTSKEYQITTNNSTQVDPDIYKDRIVWSDYRNIDWDNPFEHVQIYMHNLSTFVESPVNYGEGHYLVLDPPKIYGDRIVWQAESFSTNYNIYIYDLSNSTLSLINSYFYFGYDSQPAIYGDRIVWAKSTDSGNSIICMYDLSTSTETQITTNESSQREPAIYGDRIVWQDSRNGNHNDVTNYDIYMATLSSNLPVAAFIASPTSGKAPLKVQFTDKSTNSPTSWKWSFGDGTYSTLNNPAHTYSKAGKYTVSLTAKNAKGSNTKTMSGYVTVKSK